MYHPVSLHFLDFLFYATSSELSGDALMEEKGARMETKKPAPIAFFDTLPGEVFEAVIFFLNRLPNARKWESYFQLLDIINLYAISGEFGSFLRGRFTTLCISEDINCTGEHFLSSSRRRAEPEPTLWTKDISAARSFVLGGGGESIRTLIIGRNMYDEARDGASLVDDFLNACPNVSSMSVIEEYGSSWISKFGKQLEEAEIAGKTIPKIPPYCPNLRKLTLYSMYYDINMPDLWWRIGRNLTSLTIRGVYYEICDIGDIEMHCRNLTRVSIQGSMDEEGKDVANLLVSYGEQLEFADLYELSEGALVDVAASCRTARFRIWNNRQGISLAALNAVSTRMEKITMNRFEIAGDATEWKHSWGKCVNLRQFRGRICTIEHLKVMMVTRREHLQDLDITASADLDVAKEMVDICTRGKHGADQFVFRVPDTYQEYLEKYIENNNYSPSITIIGYDCPYRDSFFKILLGWKTNPEL